jgi:uncharacterized protein YmfQ (DUF2313 family)
MNWLNIFKHLLPNSKAWSLTAEKTLRKFFEGLSGLGEDSKEFLDEIYKDLDPSTTRELDSWEKQFALPNTTLTEQERRDRLDAAWKAIGGQDPDYIQQTLQDAGFDVYVHEWWEPVPGRSGGSVNGDVTPTPRNPFTYLWDGVSAREFIGSGHDLAFCGGDSMFSNSQNSKPGYPLVNKILEATSGPVGSGHALLFSGGTSASSGFDIVSYSQKQYIIPSDPTKYPFFLYIGGQTFPEQATIPQSRRDEFEDLCLKICPTEQWLGILVTYT